MEKRKTVTEDQGKIFDKKIFFVKKKGTNDMGIGEREGSYKKRLNLAPGFMFSFYLYILISQLYLKSFPPKICSFYFSAAKTLITSCLDLHKLLLTGLFLISSLFLIFAKCYCQVHFPFLLFRLFLPICFGFSSPSSLPRTLHLLTIPPPHPFYNPPGHTTPHSFLWLRLSSLLASVTLRCGPSSLQANTLCCRHPPPQTSQPMHISTPPIPAAKNPSKSSSQRSLLTLTVCYVLLSPRVYTRVLLVLYSCLPLLPLGPYIVFFQKNMISLLSDDFCSL